MPLEQVRRDSRRLYSVRISLAIFCCCFHSFLCFANAKKTKYILIAINHCNCAQVDGICDCCLINYIQVNGCNKTTKKHTCRPSFSIFAASMNLFVRFTDVFITFFTFLISTYFPFFHFRFLIFRRFF